MRGLIALAAKPVRLQLLARYYNPLAEEPAYTLYPRLIGSSDTVVEVGAHTGGGTYLLSLIAKEVHAFEPNPYSFYLAHSFLKRQNRKNVFLYNHGLSDRSGHAKLFVKGIREDIRGTLKWNMIGMSPKTAFTVKVEPLDSLYLRPSVIVMDVEGSELEVLQGASETLKSVSKLVVETHQTLRGHTQPQVIDFLTEHGFSLKQELKQELILKGRVNWLVFERGNCSVGTNFSPLPPP